MPLSSLNKEQYDAATAPKGRNLIIASAGTGKTSTIVGRIAYLLKNGIAPEKILLLTFTNKASGEMIARLSQYFPPSYISKIEAGTFHAVCYRWLRKARPNLTLKQPSELKTLFKGIYERRNFSRMNIDTEAFASNYLYDMYNLYQNASTKSFDEWLLERYPEQEVLMDAYVDIIEEYESIKEEYGFLSFNDLIIYTKEHIDEFDISLEEILVDEYQDTNTLQGSFIDTLKSDSLFCVGDYDQSIYAFNGANIENINTFTKRYPDARVYTLKVNYRSYRPILSLANRVIERNPRIYPKSLEVGRKGEGEPPRLLKYDELFEQYKSISHKIKNTHIDYDDIAVIFRNNASADGIEATLREVGVPCRRKGGVSFFEAKEIKFLLDSLAFLINPKDMMAFIHIFEYADGVGVALAQEIFQALSHFGEGNAIRGMLNPTIDTLPQFKRTKSYQLGLFDDDEEFGLTSRFNSMEIDKKYLSHPLLKHPKITQDAVRFFADMHKLYSSIDKNERPSAILRKIVSSNLYARVVNILSKQRAKLKSGEIDEERRETAKDRILRKARLLYDLSTQYSEADRFINAMILGGGEMSEGSGVNLLTVHASKGLEFKEVYVIDLMDGRFPNRKLMSKNGGDIEEERRLFYVAVTRAKDRLFLSYAEYDRVKKSDFKPSQFLFEAGLLKEDELKMSNEK